MTKASLMLLWHMSYQSVNKRYVLRYWQQWPLTLADNITTKQMVQQLVLTVDTSRIFVNDSRHLDTIRVTLILLVAPQVANTER